MSATALPTSIRRLSPSPGPTVDSLSTHYNDKVQCDCLQLELEPDNGSLETCFNTQIKHFGPAQGYKSVASLLLSWEDSDLNENGKVDVEVDRLGDVLKGQYNFVVEKKTIPKDLNSPASWTASSQVLEFLMKHNSNNALLIFYYAGHGFKSSPGGGFGMARTSADDQTRRELNNIVYEDLEAYFLKANADVLVIFDCCFAGELTRSRGGRPGKIFSFVGSTEHNKVARGPGPRSFTTALIYALEQLVSCSDGFTVTELLAQIRFAPEFVNTDQTPVEGSRGQRQSNRQLRLRRLPEQQAASHPVEIIKNDESIDEIQYLLRLNFAFGEAPSEHHVADLATELAYLIQSSQTPIRNVTWGILAKRTERVYLKRFRNAVKKVMERRRLSTLLQAERLASTPFLGEHLHPGLRPAWPDDASTAIGDSIILSPDAESSLPSLEESPNPSTNSCRRSKTRVNQITSAKIFKSTPLSVRRSKRIASAGPRRK